MSQLAPEPRPLSLSESAYNKIRGAILYGEFQPGERFSVVALAQTLEMSRSPVRVAVQRLESEGLLEDLGNGFVVADLAPQALFDSMAVREVLEGLAAELAAPRLPPSAVNDLAEIHDRFASAWACGDPRLAMRADLDFHQTIQSHCGNGALVRHLDRLQNRLAVVTYSKAWNVQLQREGVPEHAALLAAMRLGDPLLARSAAASHVRGAKERLQLLWSAKQSGAANGDTRGEQ